jgi:WD40 repeat protein/serine/threonine protein kinase
VKPPPSPAPIDDKRVEWLAAGDDSLATGATADYVLPDGVPADFAPELKRDLAFFHRLRRALRRPAASESAAENSALPWSSLGRFQIQRELGQGGFGIVYLAYDPSLAREVALKVPRAEVLLSTKWRDRFQREAQAAAGLDHPNLVSIYEAGEVGPVCFLVSAYCPGVTLAQWLKESAEPVKFDTAARFITTLAHAVQFAHSRGVLHRDLKPANILLSPTDPQPDTGHAPLTEYVPKITDFGLAKFLDSASATNRATRSGAILGTAGYMAPEQASGHSHEVGVTADVYALGAILYELLSGRPPFQGDSDLDVLLQVRAAEPIPVSRLRPKTPADLETICLKCLSKEPDRRYPTAEALAEDLSRFTNGQPIRARPVSSWEYLRRWCRRRPLVAGLLSAVAALLLLVFIVTAVGHIRTAAALDREALARRELDRQLYFAHMQLAQQAWHAGEMGRVEQLLNRYLPRADQPDHRGWEWNYLKARCHGLLTLRGHTGTVRAIAWSPDGGRLASVGSDGSVRVWHTADGGPGWHTAGHTNAATAVDWSPNGKHLATCGGDGTIRLWDTQDGRQIRAIVVVPEDQPTRSLFSLAWSPDGKMLASGTSSSEVLIWDADTGQKIRALEGHSHYVNALAWSPDGRLLASGAFLSDKSVRIWDVQSGQIIALLKGHGGAVFSLSWSPDGKNLASTDSNASKVIIWDLSTLRTPRRLYEWVGHHGTVNGVAWRPGGGSVASASTDGTVQIWDPLSGKLLRSIRNHIGGVYGVAWSPDGRRLASAGNDGTVRLIDALVDQGSHLLAGHDDQVWAVAWNADGSLLATAGRDRTIRIWQPKTGQCLRILRGHEGTVRAVAWSSDGQRLASAGSDSTVRTWRAADGEPELVLRARKKPALCLAWSPDGRWLASGEDYQLNIWDTHRRELVHGFPTAGSVRAVAWSPDGKRLASGWGSISIQLWDTDSWRGEQLLVGHSGAVQGLTWSPCGGRLASASFDGTAKVWDTASARELFTSSGHTGAVVTIAWSPDCRRLASGGRDIRVWEADTGHEVLTLDGHSSLVQALAWSPDGKSLASASWDHAVRIWSAEESPPPAPSRP